MVNQAFTIYERWLEDEAIDEQTKAELAAIRDQPEEIEDRFYTDLQFGTGGLRGVIGAGTNRMNRYTVGRATQGFAQYVLSGSQVNVNTNTPQQVQHRTTHAIVIAYDSRNQSYEFALEAALVMAGNGITAYVFESLRPTPELSYAVRALHASGGIVVTASHNPPEYNGYKVYGADGCQLVPHQAEQVINELQYVDSFAAVRTMKREQAEGAQLLRWIGEETDQQYLHAVTQLAAQDVEWMKRVRPQLKIVYTPLHGAGNLLVRSALKRIGLEQVFVVKEQEQPDPLFSTVASPNPEDRAAFTLAIDLAKEIDADIIIGTDPDCDRMGAIVKSKQGDYTLLSGNQSGALMIHYLLSSMQAKGILPTNGVIIKTIVTSEMGGEIARSFGMTVLNTLTGFKYIGEKITEFEKTGRHQFIFGYEESYGYLAGTYCRDKDAVLASMLICEAAAYYHSLGKTLDQVLEQLFDTHGHFREHLESRTMKGKDGLKKISEIMSHWRDQPPSQVNGEEVVEVQDYTQGIDGLPQENVLKFKLANGSWFCLRPSGTEPKIKLYFAVCGESSEDAEAMMDSLKQAVLAKVN